MLTTIEKVTITALVLGAIAYASVASTFCSKPKQLSGPVIYSIYSITDVEHKRFSNEEACVSFKVDSVIQGIPKEQTERKPLCYPIAAFQNPEYCGSEGLIRYIPCLQDGDVIAYDSLEHYIDRVINGGMLPNDLDDKIEVFESMGLIE